MFKEGDIHSEEFTDRLIDLFVEKVVVFPEKIDIYYNYIDKAHQELMLFSADSSLDTETLHSMKVAKSKILMIGKHTICLEIIMQY